MSLAFVDLLRALALVLPFSASATITSRWHTFCQSHTAWEVEFICTTVVQLSAIWIISTIYLLIDVLFPDFSRAHRLQASRPPTAAQNAKCVRYAISITILDIGVQILAGYLAHWQPIFEVTPIMPDPWQIAQEWFLGVLGYEILTYYSHRLLHHPRFYQRFHKLHHEFSAPIAFSVLYTSYTEHLVHGVGSIAVPMFLINYLWRPIHVLSFSGYLFCIVLVGTAEHSGYTFAQPAVSKYHDMHHEHFSINFGSLRFMDWLHGTDFIGWDRPTATLEVGKVKAPARKRGPKARSHFTVEE